MWSGKNLFEGESGKEALKLVISFPAKVLIKSVVEIGRDEFPDVKIFIKELEKRGDIIKEHVLTV